MKKYIQIIFIFLGLSMIISSCSSNPTTTVDDNFNITNGNPVEGTPVQDVSSGGTGVNPIDGGR